MQIKKKMRQCIIIWLLLGMVIFIDCGTRLDADAQVLFCLREHIDYEPEENYDTDCMIQTEQLIHENAYLLQEQLRCSDSLTVQGKLWRTPNSMRFDYIVGICLLALLLALSGQKNRKIHIYDNQYILQRYYHIIYIQDSDGRKKVSMP